MKKSLSSWVSISLSWKALALGEAELRGLAILTSIFLAHPLSAENVLAVVTYDSFGTGRVFEGDEPIAIVDAGLFGFQRQQDVHDLSKLLEVVLELL